MKVFFPLIVVAAIILVPIIGVAAEMYFLFGVLIPYLALITFVVGFTLKILDWAKSPVPFRIPTTCGQEKTLPWIKQNKIENPSTMSGVIARMALEVLLFRSLFRNTKAELNEQGDLVYRSSKWLWLGGLVFHWSFLVIILRHYRFFVEPVPFFVTMLEGLDGFVQIMLPTFYLSNVAILAGITYLLLRRIVASQIRYISLPNDYFPLYLIGAIAVSGILMRYVYKVDVTGVKSLVQGLVTFQFSTPTGVDGIFYVHLFLVCVLAMYFPFSKLMHMGGVFFSPTRNLANNCREKRHINPWNPEIKIRSYKEYEEDFREKMKGAELPLEKG